MREVSWQPQSDLPSGGHRLAIDKLGAHSPRHKRPPGYFPHRILPPAKIGLGGIAGRRCFIGGDSMSSTVPPGIVHNQTARRSPMLFSVIYSADCPRNESIARFRPPCARRLWDQTEGDHQYEYSYLEGEWDRGKHRKSVRDVGQVSFGCNLRSATAHCAACL